MANGSATRAASTRSTTPWCAPRPIQAHLPILVGGSGPRKTLRTVALRADAWNTAGTVDEVRGKLEILAEHCADVGRDIATIEKTVSFPILIRDDRAAAERAYARLLEANSTETWGEPASSGAPTEVADALRPYLELGFETVIVRMPAPYDRETIDRMARGRRAPRRVKVVTLAGGTGGAKLAHGLQQALPAGDLTVVVNTGDDTERHGLLVMPDHDAVMYMLAGRFDDERGWGIAGETWTVMDALAEYGEESWFRLGDRDFATHIARTARLRAGESLTGVVRSLQAALGIPTPILPMADEPVRTQVRTDEGWLDFQEYFVHRRQEPEVREVRFTGDLTTTSAVADAVAAAEVIVIGPSNPIVSIGPILAGPIATLVAEGTRRRHPGRGRQPDRRWRGAQGAGRPDARLARSRIERPGSGPHLPRSRHRVRPRHRRCGPRTGHRRPRTPDPRD